MINYKLGYEYAKAMNTTQLLFDLKMFVRKGNNNIDKRVQCATILRAIKDILIERRTNTIINKHTNVEFMEQRVVVLTQGIDRCIRALKEWGMYTCKR